MSQQGTEKATAVITIAGVGSFSLAQIETMQRVSNLAETCRDGVALLKWLDEDVMSAVGASQQSVVRIVSIQIAAIYPHSVLPWFKADFHVSPLYCLRPPPLWLNGAVVVSLYERIEQAHPSVRFGGILNGHMSSPRGNNRAELPSTSQPRLSRPQQGRRRRRRPSFSPSTTASSIGAASLSTSTTY